MCKLCTLFYSNMQASGIGLILGFFFLNFLDLKDFAEGKAFREDEDEYKYHYNQRLNRFQPIYKRNLGPKLYYPHIDGKPIFIPPVADSASHVNKLLDHYERNKEYSQSWTFTSPATYDYDHSDQKNYYEDSVTSNSMIKKLLDAYERGVYHGDYHILSSTPESYVNFESKQTNKNFKNKSDKQNLRKKDKRRKNNRDFHDISKDPNYTNSKFEVVSPDYAPGVTEVIGKKLPTDQVAEDLVDINISDYDYAPKEIDNKEQFPDDYASENVAEKKLSSPDEAVGTKFPDYFYASKEMDNKELSDEYSSEVEVIGETVVHAPGKELIDSKLDDDYSPEVVKVAGSKLADDYSPEIVKETGTKHSEDKSIGEVEEKFSVYSPEVKKVISTKQKTGQLYLPKKLLNTNGKEYEELASQEPFTSRDKIINVKRDKKRIKMHRPDKILSDFHKLEKKKSKTVHKNKSQLVKSETQNPNVYFIPTKKNSHSNPTTMSSGKLDKKTECTIKHDDDFKKENSNKIKPTMTPKNEHSTHKTHKIKVKDDVVTDSSKSTLGEHGKTTSTHRRATDLSEDESRDKMEDNSRHLILQEPLDPDESFEAFDLENPGSGDLVNNEDSNEDFPVQFSNEDFPRSLSTLNSNIWSLIFNPNAEFKKVKKCITRSNEPGFCMYVQQCDIPNVVTSLEQLLQDACVIDDIFIGICCPEFPVQTVKVHWEQMPSDTDKRTDDFAHKSDDCGIRSGAALKDRSWPWKAPLVSMSNGRIFCDGVLIRDNYVLTAAHCTRKIPKNQILVRLGQFDESSGEDYAVVEIKRHAQYNRRSMLNDIALLKLGRQIRHDEHTNRICIPDDDDDDDHEDDHAGERAILLGSRGSFDINSNKDERLKVMTNKECEQKLGMKVPATMLCTEARNENERSCNTDSGAPLIIEDDDKYEVIGILSWNRNDCDQRFPSIFSRVSKYVGWIKKHTV